MNSSIRILYLEDSPVDVELSQAILEKDGLKCEMTVVDTREDYVAALEADGYDLILADYQLPSFDGMAALEIAREKSPDLPFLFVSGAMGEEIATESLKRGATDYVLKERLARLPGSMRRALIEAEERRRLKQVERRLREQAEMLDLAQEAIFAWEMGGAISYWNRAAEEIYGYTQEEAIGRVAHELLDTQAVGGMNALL
ncbi:MAG TPA: response regulator, partial [Blastocatellia bacterium]